MSFILLAIWELGMSYMDLARHLQSSVPGLGYAVDREKVIARDNNYQLVDKVS